MSQEEFKIWFYGSVRGFMNAAALIPMEPKRSHQIY